MRPRESRAEPSAKVAGHGERMNKSCQIQAIKEDRNENCAVWRVSAAAWPEPHLTPQDEILKSQHWE